MVRIPRRSERIPSGGKRLYELLRLDHEPVYVNIFLVEEVTQDRLEFEDTLGYSREFDPMQYFWPVEGQHCVVNLKLSDEKSRQRLARALMRDKAAWVTIIVPTEAGPKFEHWGDTDGFMRSRYGGPGDGGSAALGTVGPPT